MFLTDLLGVASIAYLAQLGLGILLADAVFADQVWSTSIGSVAKVAFAAKGAVALLRNVGVERDGGEVGEAGSLESPFAAAGLLLAEGSCGWREVFTPVEVAS